ncbi:MAG: dihydrodipicolinate synthase family protein [Acidobacteriota bacterium]
MQPRSNTSTPASRKSATLDLRGLLLPFTTPFKEKEDLDVPKLRANLRRWNATGIRGYVVLGSTGERVNLDEREYTAVIDVAREEVPPDQTFIVGAGQESRRGSINEIKRAAIAGADAVLVITPHFYRAAITQQALIDHYTAVAEASPVPVILYSMPDLTGIKIEPETAAQLSTHANIIGIKDSSADVSALGETIRLVAADFAVLTGNGTVFYDALCAGACGAILAVGCVATAQCLEIYRLAQAGDGEGAARLQSKLTPLALAVTKRYGIGGLKTAMDLIGFAGGVPRAPLQPVSAAARQEIAELLEQSAAELPTAPSGSTGETNFAGTVKS